MDSTINKIAENVEKLVTPYWEHPDFLLSMGFSILGVIVSAAGLIASIKAFKAANRAKEAAQEAGKTVKIQTVMIELVEINQKIDSITEQINYIEAKNLVQSITSKLSRFTSSFTNDDRYEKAIKDIFLTIANLNDQLKDVRPIKQDQPTEIPNQVYYATESLFTNLSRQIALLTGKLEQRTIDNS